MPDITVTDIPPINTYTVVTPVNLNADTIFPFAFAVLSGSQVSVFLTPAGANANDAGQMLTYGTQYTVQINPAPAVGGTITLTLAATPQSRITIVRNTSAVRTSAYSDGTLLSASVLNNDFNSTVMIEQETNRYTTMLCPHYNQTEITDASDYVLPRLNSGQVWAKGILPGSITDANRNGIPGIVAESISNVLGGAPVALFNGPATASAIPIFADTSGNISSTNVLIDATNNITGASNISCSGLISAGNIVVNAPGSIATPQLTATNATIPTLGVTTLTSGGTTLANTQINGSLNVTGAVNIPGYVINTINANGNISTTARISAPTIIASANLMAEGSATISGSLSVGIFGVAGTTTTINNQLIANNYSPANFTPRNINATGYVAAQTLLARSGFVLSHDIYMTTIVRTSGADHTLVLPGTIGIQGQILTLKTVTGNVGTLDWTDAGGVLAGVNAVGNITAGNLVKFNDANGNITNSNITVSNDANNDIAAMRNVTTANGGTVSTGTIKINDPTGTTSCSIAKPNGGNAYGLALPPSGPVARNQPLVATSVGINANCTLGWGSVAPPRVFTKISIVAGNLVTSNSVNIQEAAWFAGNGIVATVNNAIGIILNFLNTTFVDSNYMVKITCEGINYSYIGDAINSTKTYNSCVIQIRILGANPPVYIVGARPDIWNDLGPIYIECTAAS
jgi:hypothetical protein